MTTKRNVARVRRVTFVKKNLRRQIISSDTCKRTLGAKNVMNETCGKEFGVVQSLQRHMLSHSAENRLHVMHAVKPSKRSRI